MQGLGVNIGKALRGFCKSVVGRSVGLDDELHEACWMDEAYPKALKALMKLPQFEGREEIADAYICGYWRGLRDATYLSEKK